MLGGADGYIHMHKQIGTILQLFAGNTENGTEEKMWTNERCNRHTKIKVEVCTYHLILQ
jgi:hypothetical protein